MTHHTRPIRIALPPLSDQGAVDILEFLREALECFESRYGAQIHRYYYQQSQHNLRRPAPPPRGTDDVPF